MNLFVRKTFRESQKNNIHLLFTLCTSPRHESHSPFQQVDVCPRPFLHHSHLVLKRPAREHGNLQQTIPYPSPKNIQGVPKKEVTFRMLLKPKSSNEKFSATGPNFFHGQWTMTWERFFLLSLSKVLSNITITITKYNFFHVDVLKEFFSRSSHLNSHLDNLKNGDFEEVELCCWSHFQSYRNLSTAEFLFQE